MGCTFCKKLHDWLSGPDLTCADIQKKSERWEQDHSNEWNLWIADSEDVRDLNEQANLLAPTDPKRAFDIRKELADNGSVWALRHVGKQYQFGLGVESDFEQAERYFYKAQLAGSWMATLQLSKLLFNHHINEKWVGILENGVESEFIPANFWLAFFRFKRNPNRRMAREVRSLMEVAAQAGHPWARLVLAHWKARGKFGLQEIRQGFRDNHLALRDLEVDQHPL